MPRFIRLLLLLSSFALGPASFGAVSESAPLPLTFFQNLAAARPQTVVTYGTSLTAAAEWPDALHRYFDRHFPGQVACFNAAQSGQHSNWGLANLDARVLSHKPDLVFIEFSVNDAATKHGISVAQSVANLDTLVQTLRRQNPSVDIIVQTMNPAWDSPASAPKLYASDRPELATYYAACRDYARDHRLPLVDHYPVWAAIQQSDPARFHALIPDGIHPAPEASLTITWPAIETLLEQARLPAL